jgi:glycosyltransferase involved in cell wall biosynthesis
MRETVVVVTDRNLYPVRRGNQARIIELVRSLKALGMHVVLIAPRFPSRLIASLPGPRSALGAWLLPDELIQVDARPFTRGPIGGFDPAPFCTAVARATERHQPAAVIAEYLWMAPCLDAAGSDTLRVLDTHDVMHVRQELYAGRSDGVWVACTREEEAGLLDRADVVLAIQHHEQRLFAEMLPGKRVVCVPHSLRVPDRPRPVPLQKRVGFVGSAIAGNVAGITTFVERAWPRVRRAHPDAELRLYGDVAGCIAVNAPGVARVGYVRSLAAVYRAAPVVINPVTLGTGLKIKTVEALANGRALVTTSCGAAGIEEGEGTAFLLEDDPDRFGDAVAELLSDPDRQRALGQSAWALARRRFGRDAGRRERAALLAYGPQSRASAREPQKA